MTQLLDRPLAANATRHPSASPARSEVRAAEDFFLRSPDDEPAPQITIHIDVPTATVRSRWLAAYLQDQINPLLRLRDGWDGRHGHPLSPDAVGSVIGLLFAVVDDMVVPPQLFPLPDVGLQFEWLVAGRALEVEVDADGDAHVLATGPDGAIVINENLDPRQTGSLATLGRAVRELSARLVGGR